MREFDMPPASASFEARGGWVIHRLMAEPGLGLTNIIHPAAIVGNIGGESGMQAINEKSPMVPGSRGGFGWCQWTALRRRQFEKYCTNNGFNFYADEAQYNFLVWELLNTEKKALEQLKKTTTLDAAVYTFEVAFERPSDPQGGLPSRIAFAKRALAGAADQVAPGAPSAPPASRPTPAPKPKRPAPVAEAEEVDVSLDLMPTAVRMVQLLLRGAGVYEGEIDGAFGPQCEAAMREFRAWERENK